MEFDPISNGYLLIYIIGACSKVITKTSYHVIKDVVYDCSILEFAKTMMEGFQETWICYLHFQFTDPENITPLQRIIIQKMVYGI